MSSLSHHKRAAWHAFKLKSYFKVKCDSELVGIHSLSCSNISIFYICHQNKICEYRHFYSFIRHCNRPLFGKWLPNAREIFAEVKVSRISEIYVWFSSVNVKREKMPEEEISAAIQWYEDTQCNWLLKCDDDSLPPKDTLSMTCISTSLLPDGYIAFYSSIISSLSYLVCPAYCIHSILPWI